MTDILTDDEKAFLAQCEEDFADRYTVKDYDYQLHMQIGMSSPPCVEPWYPKAEGGQGGRDNRGQRGDNNYRNQNNGSGYRGESSNKRKRN